MDGGTDKCPSSSARWGGSPVGHELEMRTQALPPPAPGSGQDFINKGAQLERPHAPGHTRPHWTSTDPAAGAAHSSASAEAIPVRTQPRPCPRPRWATEVRGQGPEVTVSPGTGERASQALGPETPSPGPAGSWAPRSSAGVLGGLPLRSARTQPGPQSHTRGSETRLGSSPGAGLCSCARASVTFSRRQWGPGSRPRPRRCHDHFLLANLGLTRQSRR